MSPTEISALVGVSGALGAGLLKAWDLAAGKAGRQAATEKVHADTKVTEAAAAQAEVTMLRDIIAEVRTSEAKKSERIDNLERRMELLEERERHMLTRAAVHEAWDQMAFAHLLKLNPDHPAPPPLSAADTH